MPQPSPRQRSLIIPTLFTLAMCAFLCGLGIWQMERLRWKEGLIHEVASRTTQPAIAAPAEASWSKLTQNDLEYSHWQVSGHFDHAREVRVFANLPDAKGPARGVGYWIVTPLSRSDGSTVLINRGFVPETNKNPASRAAGQVEGPITIAGLARWTEDRNPFTPADNPATGDWFTRDIQGIAAAEHLSRVAPFFIDAEASAPGGLPQGGETLLSFPNNHFQYALTWFGLAIGLLGVYATLVWRRWSARSREGA